jgi:hypothetical protein
VGFTRWPTLTNAYTRSRGALSVAQGELRWQEYAVIEGEDEVEIPAFYKAELLIAQKVLKGYHVKEFKVHMIKDCVVKRFHRRQFSYYLFTKESGFFRRFVEIDII